MTLDEVLRHYDACHYTVTDTLLAILQLVSSDNVDAVLAALPDEVRVALGKFVGYYHPGVRILNGPIPAPEAVRLVKDRLATLPDK